MDYNSSVGWTSPSFPASKGFVIWDIQSNVLDIEGSSTINATIYLEYPDTDNLEQDPNARIRARGPAVYVKKQIAVPASSSGGVSSTVIIVPVVIGVLVLATAGICIWRCREEQRPRFRP